MSTLASEAMRNPRAKLEAMVRTRWNSPLLDFAWAFDVSKDNAYIHGPVGTGKTYLAHAVMNRTGGTMFRAVSIPRFVRQAFDTEGVTEGELIRTLCGEKISKTEMYVPGIRVLGIDDIGIERISDYAESVICEILDRRYDRGIAGLVVTSNLTLDVLAEKIGSERIASRIAQVCKVFDLAGEKDWRVGSHV